MIPWVLLALSVCATTATGPLPGVVPPRNMDSVVRIVEALELINDGATNGGIINGGIINGGITKDGITNGGVTNGGIVNGGVTMDGVTNGGIINGGVTKDGITNGGIINGGIVNGGVTKDGDTNDGVVNDGTTNNGTTNNGVTNDGITNNGTTSNGTTNDGVVNHGVTPPVLQLARALGACSTPGCRAVLGEPPEVPPAPPTLPPEQWLLFTRLLRHDAAVPEHGAVLAPDGSTVALGPLLAGIEVGLKRAAGWRGATTEPPLDALYAVTITEALATSFLSARGANRTTLGPGGCWDDVDNPQNYTLLGPPSPIPDAVANGAMDGVLLGAQLAQGPIPLANLLRGYYGTADGTQGRPPSSYRRRRFGALTGSEKLEEEVLAMLKVLRVLPPTQALLEDVAHEEVTAIARRAARDFMEVYVECPPIVPRCMWGARPYRGSPKALTLPLDSVYIHHTFTPSAPCRTFAACARAMRAMQRFHQDARGWDDIGYSFVVGSDGYLYQGRGWHWVGAHTKGYNSKGFGVGYVGDFSATVPDADAIALVRDGFLPCAVRAGRLRRNYTLRGHRQMGHTECPGNSLFREIETWHGFK